MMPIHRSSFSTSSCPQQQTNVGEAIEVSTLNWQKTSTFACSINCINTILASMDYPLPKAPGFENKDLMMDMAVAT